MKKTISDAGAAQLQTMLARIAAAKTPAERALLSQQMKDLVANDPGKGATFASATPAPREALAETRAPVQIPKTFVAEPPSKQLESAIASWSDQQGKRSADALIEAGLILRTEGSRAAEIIAREIRARLAAHDYPLPNSAAVQSPPETPT